MADIDELQILYSAYLQACNAHDLAKMTTFYAADITVNDTPMDPKAVAAQFEPVIAAFPDWHWHVRHVWTSGDTIALHFTVTGTHQGTFMGVPPTGRRIHISEFTVYQVRAGQFSAVWDLADMAAALDQIRAAHP